jgi:hypothetical protein
VFERVVEACITGEFVDGKGIAVDASLIVADANKQRSIPGKEWTKTRHFEAASRAVKEHLATLDDAAAVKFRIVETQNRSAKFLVLRTTTIPRFDL